MTRYLIIGLTLVLVAVWTAVLVLPDNKLHVVVCDVGQGDAILVWQGYIQMLVDSGPNNDVQACLGANVPFYDRKIDLVILTHPDSDHVGGMAEVVSRYKIGKFLSVPVGTQTTAYQNLLRQITNHNVQIVNVYAGDEIRFGDMKFEVVWPERQWVLGASTEKPETNEYSIGGILRFGEFDMMFTGDADIGVLDDQLATGLLSDVDVLKVAHHGSKFGTTSSWLSVVKPELAVVSVGKNNRYGHPTGEVVELLSKFGIKLLRTDLDGEIEIVSDGSSWSVK